MRNKLYSPVFAKGRDSGWHISREVYSLSLAIGRESCHEIISRTGVFAHCLLYYIIRKGKGIKGTIENGNGYKLRH